LGLAADEPIHEAKQTQKLKDSIISEHNTSTFRFQTRAKEIISPLSISSVFRSSRAESNFHHSRQMINKSSTKAAVMQ
jgi:hypothetical protein